jgi:hypothetical protein
MKYLILTAFLCCFLVTSGQQWVKVGSSAFHPGKMQIASIAVDAFATPYVSYRNMNNGQAHVLKYNGNSWVDLPWANLPYSGNYCNIPIAIDANNLPNVSMIGCTPTCYSLLKRFSGTAWTTIGDSTMFPNWTDCQSFVIDANNVPYIAYTTWQEKISVRKLSSSNTWVQVGIPEFASGKIGPEALAVDGNGVPYVVCGTADYKLTVYKFDGASWVVVGTPGFTPPYSASGSLDIDNMGNPYVAFQNYASAQKPTVMKFDGLNWINVGNAGFGQYTISSLSFKLDPNNVPVILLQEGQYPNKISAMKFDGSNWQYVGNTRFTDTAGFYPALAIAPNGTLYCVSLNNNNISYATVMKYGGGTSVENYKGMDPAKVTVTPNPASDKVCIGVNGVKGNVSILVYNTFGQVVKYADAHIEDSKRIVLSLDALVSGTYYLQVNQQYRTASTVLIKL